MSTPSATASTICRIFPTPMRYLGRSSGRVSTLSRMPLTSRCSGSPTLTPPMAYPSNPIETSSRAQRSRKSAYSPPCTMPKSSCPSARGCSAQEAAHVRVLDTAAQAYSRSQGCGAHSSNTMAMSDPKRRWISIDSFGPMNSGLPSTCELNSTPSSRTRVRRDRLKTWYPPLSVSSGPSHPMKRCSPPHAATTSMPGRIAR